MPFLFILAFFFLYILLVLRSIFSSIIGYKISKCLKLKYKKPIEDNSDSDEEVDIKKKSKIGLYFKSIFRSILNNFIWLRNVIVWGIREKSTFLQLRRLFNKVLGASLSFIVFFYLRIMTTSFQIFGCDYQPNGIYTLKESPDIVCFQGIWFIFLPLSILSIILFGIGAMIYFSILIINYKRWEKSESFILINRFTLKKYKKKFFYWQFFDSFRKLAFSLLTVFFKPMFLITIGIAIIFTGMMLNVHFIPYRKKFHNLMHYFVLMSTLMTLFAGLLLFVVDNNARSDVVIDPGLKQTLSYVLPIITIILIIGSNLVVVGMFLVDIYIRRKKAKKRVKRKLKKKEIEMEQEEKLTNTLNAIHGIVLDRNKSMVPWETEHDFHFKLIFDQQSDVEDDSKSMNEILSNLFSFRRARRKGFLIKRAGKRATLKILKKNETENSSKSTKELLKSRKNMRIEKMPNGFIIKSDFNGNITFITSTNKKSEKISVQDDDKFHEISVQREIE